MNRLKFLRLSRGLSQRELGRLSSVNASYICTAESRGLTLYEGQAKRLSDALGWDGDPMALFEEVKEVA